MQLIGIVFFLGMMLEFSTLFAMISWLGGWKTLILMVLGMLAGGVLMRHNLGVAKVMMAGQFLRGGGMSLYDMMLPIRIPLAGLLLAMPTGFLSSLLGLILLIPFKGKALPQQNAQQQQKAHFEQHGFQYRHTRDAHQDGDVIEGEYTVKSKPSSSAQADVIEHQK